MTRPTPHYVAVIPAYNEAATIRAVAARTLKAVGQVIVVDDGSCDQTAEALHGLPVAVISHPRNLGKGAALWHGMQAALKAGATAVLTLDGDGQHEPDDIAALIAMHQRDPTAIVTGARLHQRQHIPRLRYCANRAANFWISWAAGYRIQDSQSGFRLYPSTLLQAVGPGCDAASGFAFESELLIEAGRLGASIRAVPVSTNYGRHLRQSHFRQVRDVLRITRMVAQKLLARRLDVTGLIMSRRQPAVLYRSTSTFRVSLNEQPPSRRRRVLFIAEAVTLAHVARAAVLARTLDSARYDVHLACDRRYLHLFTQLPATIHSIQSIGSQQFQDRLLTGSPLYSAAELRTYVQQDLRLLADLNPDAVVGDFRLSLSVSARVAAVPYLTVTNAHWSPYAKQHFVVPKLAMTERFGPRLGQLLFTLIRPAVFAQQAQALNRVRKEYGLPSVGYTLPHIFTDADETAYADLPELVPTFDRPPHHHYLGPVLWSPDSAPPWWDSVPNVRPMAYVSLGTSGRAELLPLVLQALEDLGVYALVSTAGKAPPSSASGSAWVSRYLPGLEAATRADFVICNGGSATVYQALAAGVPVLGIPNNLDQYLMMDYIRRAGAGDYLRAGDTSARAVTNAVDLILHTAAYRRQAHQLGQQIRSGRLGTRFEGLLALLLGPLTPDRDVRLYPSQNGAAPPLVAGRSERSRGTPTLQSLGITSHPKRPSQEGEPPW